MYVVLIYIFRHKRLNSLSLDQFYRPIAEFGADEDSDAEIPAAGVDRQNIKLFSLHSD
jgi:hypothetical protein